MEEIWKDIPEYEGLYQASNLGNIKSLDRQVNGANQFGCKFKNIKKGRILKQHINQFGYKRVILVVNNKAKNFQTHRLIAKTFIPNPNNLNYINHKDENKLNNCIDNLEWCSCSYNINYGNRNKLVAEKLKKYKRTKQHCLNLSKSCMGRKVNEKTKSILREKAIMRKRDKNGRFVKKEEEKNDSNES